ncbi:MAG: DUF5985 family protein [Myxococcota bacterium]
MAAVVYALCALASAACATLLLRAYRQSHARLLLWSALCFLGLGVNNVLLFVDRVLVPHIDLSLWRSGSAVVALMMLLYGLIWEAE